MKILGVHAGTRSMELLVSKLESFWKDAGADLEVEICSLNDYEKKAPDYDLIMIAPQVAYRKDDIASGSGKPVVVIEPMDYALGNVGNITWLISNAKKR